MRRPMRMPARPLLALALAPALVVLALARPAAAFEPTGNAVADGFLRIVERKKDLIKTSSGKIARQPCRHDEPAKQFGAIIVQLDHSRRFKIAAFQRDLHSRRTIFDPQTQANPACVDKLADPDEIMAIHR